MKSIVYNMDCMEAMRNTPDKFYDLALVDPPYGIGEHGKGLSRHRGGAAFTVFENKKWDFERPTTEYFIELKRVSKEQIIWGGNYFVEHLQPSMGWIFWNKLLGGDFSDGELAYTSYQRALKMFTKSPEKNYATNRISAAKYKRIHPCQKPVKLYEWIYDWYLPKGGKVLDTHLGSGSNRIAAHKSGNIDFTGYEIDKDYFEAQEKRFQNYISQLTLDFKAA